MNNLLTKTNLFLKRNSSTILTGVGVIGVIATAVSAAVATPKALRRIHKEGYKRSLTKWERVKLAAPAYIPTALIGASTITCVLGANILNKRHQAALTSAYALLDTSYKEYKQKVKDIYGEESQNRIMQDLYDDKQEELPIPEEGRQIFFDFFSLQFFESSIADIKKAERFVNSCLRRRGYVSLGEFYDELGIECTDTDCALGWSTNLGYDKVEFTVEVVTDGGKDEKYVLNMPIEPTPLYGYY